MPIDNTNGDERGTINRRTLLKVGGSSIAALSIGPAGNVRAGPSNTEPKEKQDIFKILKEKYGEKEAKILYEGIEGGEDKESLLTDPKLTQVREDYLEFQYNRPKEHRDLGSAIEEAASAGEIKRSKQTSELSLQSSQQWGNPCYNCGSVNNCSSGYDGEVTWNSAQFETSNWGAGLSSAKAYCGDFGQYQERPFGVAGRAYAAGAGGADVYLRLRTPDFTQPEDDVKATIRLVGSALNADGEVSLLRITWDHHIERKRIRRISVDLDTTINALKSFNFKENDSVGIELYLSADALGFDASWMDYRFNNNRGMWIDDITY